MYTRKNSSRYIWLVAILVVFSFASCNKKLDLVQDGKPVVKLNFLGIDNSVSGTAKANGFRSSSAEFRTGSVQQAEQMEQVVQVPYGDGLSVIATLTPIVETQQAASQKRAAIERQTLTPNTRFIVLVYDKDNALVAERTYQYQNFDVNNDDVHTEFEGLNFGEKYTFIVYSNNTTGSSPGITGKSILHTATLDNVDTELLYYQKELTIGSGINYLDVILKHQFSAVKTTIDIAQDGDLAGSTISAIQDVRVLPTYTSSTFTLYNGNHAYNGPKPAGTLLQGVTIAGGGTSVTSNSTLVIGNGAANGTTFRLGAFTVNDFIGSLDLGPFTLEPGTRYDLKVQIGVPCTELTTVTGADGTDAPNLIYVYNDGLFEILNRADGDPRTATFSFPGSDIEYGAEIDIYKLDNSFNMKINGTPLYTGYKGSGNAAQRQTNELEFQGDQTPNIQFDDGSIWSNSGSGIGAFIYNLQGRFNSSGNPVNGAGDAGETNIANSRPILKIVIDKLGIVKMYGSKNHTGTTPNIESGGAPFYPLSLITTGTTNAGITGSFNNITWNSGANTNSIEISQTVVGATHIFGAVRGKKKVPCTAIIP